MNPKRLYALGMCFTIGLPLATAYIDPGTGGLIIGPAWQFIVGIVTVITAFILKFFYNPIKSNLLKILKRQH